MASRGTINNHSAPFGFRDEKRRALSVFLNVDCESGKIDFGRASEIFNYMLNWRSRLPIQHHSNALSFYKKLSVSGFTPNLSSFSILVKTCSSLGSLAFSAFGLILKKPFRYYYIR